MLASDEGAEDTEPRDRRTESAAEDQLDEVERREAQEQSRPGERGEHERVVPERSRALREVDEIGEQVRRVGKEHQPQEEQRRGQWIYATA